MLSSILMTAALAAGVVASPLEKRRLIEVTKTNLHYDIKTVTRTVTAMSTPDLGVQKDVDTNDDSGSDAGSLVTESLVVTVSATAAAQRSPLAQLQNNIQQKQAVPAKTSTTAAATPAATSATANVPKGEYADDNWRKHEELTQQFVDRVLNSHNHHRANHSVNPLVWSNEMYENGKITGATCNYAHDTATGGGGYGQNIAAGVVADNITAVISNMFYNGEEPLYAAFYGQEPDMSNFEAWGHFTQMVWKSTTSVACYVQNCQAKGLAGTGDGVMPYFTVCNYKGPGNWAGQYADNVPAPRNDATVDWAASY